MKKVPFLLLYLILLLIPDNVYAGDYSLHDLYRLALEKSEIIQIAEEDLFISEKQKDKARAVLFPTLSAFGAHRRYSEEKVYGFDILQPDHTSEWGLRLDQSLSLSGKEITALEITKEEIGKSTHDLQAVKEGILLDVASRYFIVLQAREALEIARQNVERLQKHRNAASTRLEVGEATKTVLLRAEAELAGARSDLIKAENNLIISKTRLAQSVNISGDYSIKEPQVDVDYTMPEKGVPGLDILTEDCTKTDIDCLKEIAFRERAEIQSAMIKRDIAENTVKFAQGAYWPDISIEGVYFRQEIDPSSSFDLKERIYGGLRLDFPFFEGGLRIAEVSEAKARLRQAEYGVEDLKRAIAVEVENSYLFVVREAAVLVQLQAEVKYSSENYNSVTRQFQYGLADSVDVMDANTLLVTAEREQATAKYAYQLSVISLQRSMGTLLESVTGRQ